MCFLTLLSSESWLVDRSFLLPESWKINRLCFISGLGLSWFRWCIFAQRCCLCLTRCTFGELRQRLGIFPLSDRCSLTETSWIHKKYKDDTCIQQKTKHLYSYLGIYKADTILHMCVRPVWDGPVWGCCLLLTHSAGISRWRLHCRLLGCRCWRPVGRASLCPRSSECPVNKCTHLINDQWSVRWRAWSDDQWSQSQTYLLSVWTMTNQRCLIIRSTALKS